MLQKYTLVLLIQPANTNKPICLAKIALKLEPEMLQKYDRSLLSCIYLISIIYYKHFDVRGLTPLVVLGGFENGEFQKMEMFVSET